MLLLLQGQGGAPPGDDGGDEDEMDKDELWASSSLQISAPHLKDTSSSAPWYDAVPVWIWETFNSTKVLDSCNAFNNQTPA